MMSECADQADDTVRHEAGCLRQIVSSIFADSFGVLIEPASESDKFASIGHPLQVDERNASGLEVPGSRDSQGSREIDGALAMSRMRLGHGVIYCRHKLGLVNKKELLRYLS